MNSGGRQVNLLSQGNHTISARVREAKWANWPYFNFE